MDKRALIVAGVILVLPLVMLGIWALQGQSMEDDFAEALRNEAAKALHLDLQNKQWTEEELETVDVVKVPGSYGREQALTRAAHSRGRIFVSRRLYQYQGTVRDDTTGIVHVFGFRRDEPLHWCWDQFHPDSMQVHIQRRMKQVEELKKRAAAEQSS